MVRVIGILKPTGWADSLLAGYEVRKYLEELGPEDLALFEAQLADMQLLAGNLMVRYLLRLTDTYREPIPRRATARKQRLHATLLRQIRKLHRDTHPRFRA